MILDEALRTGFREMWTHKFRSVLSFSAVSVGVASILYTFGQTRGMREALEKAITLMGPGRMQIEAKRDFISRGLSPGLTLEDAEEIRRTIPELYMVSPRAKRWQAALRYQGRKVEGAPILGVTQEWRKRDWVYALRGRFLNRGDVARAARVCVVIEPGGLYKKPFWAAWWRESALDRFFARHDPLGKQILLENRLFTVVGVLKEPPRDLDPRWFHWEDNAVLIPVTAFHRHLPGSGGGARRGATSVDDIQIDAGSGEAVKAAKRRIEAILKRRHRGEQDYEIKDNRDMIEQQLSETRRYILTGTVLGMVALLAGGIGIMNVTLASIFARTKEIGIRRALGATTADITAQFVTEAMFLGLSGGLAGVALGYWGIAYLARVQSDRDLAELTWQHMAYVVLIGTAVSCLFSLYPARQAARLDPVAALKEE